MEVVIKRYPYTGLKPSPAAADATYIYSVRIESPPSPSNTSKGSQSACVTHTYYQTWSAVCSYINGLSGSEPT
jgi:hypothetical protein